MVLIRCKIFRRIRSPQRTRKTHKNYELGKVWRNKCAFKWALNCKKLVISQRLLFLHVCLLFCTFINYRTSFDHLGTNMSLFLTNSEIMLKIYVCTLSKEYPGTYLGNRHVTKGTTNRKHRNLRHVLWSQF